MNIHAFIINQLVKLSVKVQYLEILSLDALDEHVENIEGDISLLLCVIFFSIRRHCPLL